MKTQTYFKVIGDPPFAIHQSPEVVGEAYRAGITSCSVETVKQEWDPALRVNVTASLGKFNFQRLWRYWTVRGPVPLKAARAMYADPVGRESVRVAGHCGCPPPEDWVNFINGEPYVMTYHIDTEEGLKLFVETIKELQ